MRVIEKTTKQSDGYLPAAVERVRTFLYVGHAQRPAVGLETGRDLLKHLAKQHESYAQRFYGERAKRATELRDRPIVIAVAVILRGRYENFPVPLAIHTNET